MTWSACHNTYWTAITWWCSMVIMLQCDQTSLRQGSNIELLQIITSSNSVFCWCSDLYAHGTKMRLNLFRLSWISVLAGSHKIVLLEIATISKIEATRLNQFYGLRTHRKSISLSDEDGCDDLPHTMNQNRVCFVFVWMELKQYTAHTYLKGNW